MKPGPKPTDIAIANMLRNPSLQPDGTKETFKLISELTPTLNQIDESIKQTQNSLNGLYDQKTKILGSFDALVVLLERTISADLIEKHGAKLYDEDKKA